MSTSIAIEDLLENGTGTELQSTKHISISIDLVSVGKQLLRFLKTVSGLPHLHGGLSTIQAIHRYLNCWMPLIAKCDSTSDGFLIPPIDVQWIWLCHLLKPKSYGSFCRIHYSKIIDVPIFLELSNQDDVQERTRKLWNETYPNEPFDFGPIFKNVHNHHTSQVLQSMRRFHLEEKELMESILRNIAFYNQVSQEYMQHEQFLKVARERYRCFLYMLQRSGGRIACRPTCDIELMERCHQTSPLLYVHDTENLCGVLEKIYSSAQHQSCNAQSFEQTSRLWELLFGNPYERAGALFSRVSESHQAMPVEYLSKFLPITINWDHQSFDINSQHAFLQPRHVVEVCIHFRSVLNSKIPEDGDSLFLRVRTMQACRKFRNQISLEGYGSNASWQKLWCMQCEVSTQGIVIDLILKGANCFIAPLISKKLDQITVSWKELQKRPCFESEQTLKTRNKGHVSDSVMVLSSITPPIQAPYLLRALLDRVTDDTGAMISKKIVRINKNKPQVGRWMSRTVLDHAGRECFIIRIRVATGIWRSKIESPVGVDWNERIICIHSGGWKYIKNSVGIAPEGVLATATPRNDELEQYKMKWTFSTGEILMIQMPIENLEWERNLRFSLKGNQLGMIRLLNGRHMRYEISSSVPEEEEGFVTLVRYTADARQGRATALFNWKLLAMEVLPEEDVVLVLLICIATQRSVADLGAKTLRSIYRRKLVKSKERQSNWGSVVLGERHDAPAETMFWYVNPEDVLGVNLAEMESEEVLPKGASEHMYRGTSWLYSGSMKGLYKMSSKGSYESFSHEMSDYHRSSAQFGAQTKVSLGSR
ncbi:hypothetical protein KP509_16G074000 [Ceratopteris richardii]|uniref:GRPD C-terminal domain-containing protein n=1 Tax=Ceratopteris richardii TaxID=49495 RepID=A0A8T2T3K9_CERRI|nr:hypothetical protein KP509_16G074000 [Ceratopteris richardii]